MSKSHAIGYPDLDMHELNTVKDVVRDNVILYSVW
jgi:hypothetical protein